jgi:hypothetical protein
MKRALLVLLALAPLALAQEKVRARRLSDVVSVREGPSETERVLYYFNPTVDLVQGDELEQGSGGHSELTLEGDGLLILYSNAHVKLDKLAAEGDVLAFPTLTRVEATTGDRPLQLALPGGTTCDLLQAHVTVKVEYGRLLIRNEAGTPVHVHSDLRLERQPPDDVPAGDLDLTRGEEVRLVLVAGEAEESGESLMLWGVLPVRHTGDIDVLPEGDQLRVHAPPGDSLDYRSNLTVGGVRTVPRPGLVVRNPRHEEPPPAPVVPVPEAPAAPAAGDQPPPADEGVPPAAPAGDQPK